MKRRKFEEKSVCIEVSSLCAVFRLRVESTRLVPLLCMLYSKVKVFSPLALSMALDVHDCFTCVATKDPIFFVTGGVPFPFPTGAIKRFSPCGYPAEV